MNEWAGQPLPISATAWYAGILSVRLSGAGAALRTARDKLGGEVIDDAQAAAFWQGIREQTDPFFAGTAPLWRLSVAATAAPFAPAGEQLIEWGGALRWLRTALPAQELRAIAAAADGHATLFRGGDRSLGVFQPLPAAAAAIHKRLKAEFDPAGIFNSGRMYSEF
jgi:glycolate oxidase FAD binding subunit